MVIAVIRIRKPIIAAHMNLLMFFMALSLYKKDDKMDRIYNMNFWTRIYAGMKISVIRKSNFANINLSKLLCQNMFTLKVFNGMNRLHDLNCDCLVHYAHSFSYKEPAFFVTIHDFNR